VVKSGTRKEQDLYHPDEYSRICKFRLAVADLTNMDAMNLFMARLKKTNNNFEFLLSLKD
jgi:transcription termination factor Rho